MPDPQPAGSAGPPGGPPPAPPGVGEPPHAPDPGDPGAPIAVELGGLLLGDLGHPRVDARLLQALIMRRGHVSEWLRHRGIGLADVEQAFPGTGWPLQPDTD